MTCREARQLMLEADVAELRGDGSGALALHLQSCGDCHAAAARILRASAGLDDVLARAGEPARRTRRRASALLPLSLAAAAVLALILVRPRARPFMMDEPPVAAVATEPDVVVSGRDVAVIRTANPNITVVWFF